VTYRLSLDVLQALEDETIADGRERKGGRVFSPSATLERILRSYFAAKKPERGRRTK
jgi:hypothetical protein